VVAGAVPLKLTYAGAQPTYPGLDRINALMSPSLAGRGQITLRLIIVGTAANPVTIAVP
jgi:uncharacterized protein (TIGR03437 family)